MRHLFRLAARAPLVSNRVASEWNALAIWAVGGHPFKVSKVESDRNRDEAG